MRGANRQAAHVLIWVPSDFNLAVLEQAVFARVRRAANIVDVAIFWRDALNEFTRQEILDNTFRDKIR